MMLKRTLLSLCFLSLIVGSSGEENVENVKGILGETATFVLKTSEQLKRVFWLRNTGKQDSENFVLATPQKETCELTDELRPYRGRLSVSEDCKRLQINNLNQEDSGTYTAQIRTDAETMKELFPLTVYKCLLEADLEIHCNRKGSHGGNGTLQLNCSAGTWEDDVTFSWAPADLSESTGRSLVISYNLEGNDLNFTCIAENPVSKASKTVSLQEICSGRDFGSIIWPIFTVVVFVPIICAVLFVWWKKKRGSRRKQLNSAHQSEPKETCHTEYSQIENFPQNSPLETQQRRGPKGKKEAPQTIYITVNLPKQNPLQTDDEKMQRTKGKSEKTIYSEITKPQEYEDQDSKTVYETVNNPRLLEATEYNKIL